MTEVYKAIAAVQAEMAKEGIAKGRKNQQQGYAFRGIDDVYAALSPVLAANSLCVIPRMIERIEVERKTAKGGLALYVTVHAEFDFVSAKDGSKHTASTYGEAMDTADKATNKAMSAAYKYAAFMTFAIPTEGDNDADAVTHEIAPREVEQPKEPRQHISDEQRDELATLIDSYGYNIAEICQAMNIKSLKQIWADQFGPAKDFVNNYQKKAA